MSAQRRLYRSYIMMSMLYLFFACAGILAAYVREGKEAEIQKQAVYENNACSTDIELNF